MYYAFFGLRQPPFKITPNTEFFFPGGNRGPVLDALVYAVTHGEGIVKVTGEVGSGKTMLCRMLEQSLPDHVETVYLANPSVAPNEILHAIAFELHLTPRREAGRLEVLQALQEYLLKRHEEGKQVVLFVEEAQAMPMATLEEIRLLSNLETQHHKLLQIVLFGQPELDELLADPQIRQLRERIVHSFHLDPLNTTDTRAYLNFRMRQAGYTGPDVFGVGAVREIARASLGLTRRINIIADKALLAAYSEHTHNVTARHVLMAAKDSEFVDFARQRRGRLVAGAALMLALGVALGWGMAHLWDHDAPAVAAVPVVSASPPATPTPAVAAMSPASAPAAADIVEARLVATQTWLERSPPTTVSIHIQLLGAADRNRLAQYLGEIGKVVDLQQVFVYRTKAAGKPVYSVLYGSFPDRSAGNAALSALPAALNTHRPYLRSVQGIRAELEAQR